MKGTRKRNSTERMRKPESRKDREPLPGRTGPSEAEEQAERSAEKRTPDPASVSGDQEDIFPDEVMEEELSELLASLPDDVMLTLLTEFGLTEGGV